MFDVFKIVVTSAEIPPKSFDRKRNNPLGEHPERSMIHKQGDRNQ
jgi:hypothetical protein